MGNKKSGDLKLSISFFFVIVTAIAIAFWGQSNPILGAEPTGRELTGPNNIITDITFEKTTDVPITEWNPGWNYDIIKLNIKWSDMAISDGTTNSPRTDGIQDGDWFKVGVPKAYFHGTFFGVNGNILRVPAPGDLDQSTPVIGNYYVENWDDPLYYWVYVEFNTVPSAGSAENSNTPYHNVNGNVFLNLSFNSFATTVNEPFSATFPNSAGFTYTLNGHSPGATNWVPFQKYGEMSTGTKDGKQVFITDSDGAYQFGWSIRINYTMDNQGNLNTYHNLVVEDRLVMPASNPTHEYKMINGMPAYAIYEYIGTNAAADLQNGTFLDETKSIIYTNKTGYTRSNVIYDEDNIKGHPLSDLMTLAPDGKSIAFDMGAIFGTIDKPFRLEVHTKTTPEFSFPNYDLNGETGAEYAKVAYLHDNIRNEIHVDGLYKHGTYVSIPQITHGAQAVGENFGKLKLNKVSDTENPPTLITTDNPTFDLYKKTGDNQWVKLYELTLTNGTATTSNLDYGTYRLIETKAPEGYYIDPNPHDFIIDLGSLDSNKLFTYDFFNSTTPVEILPPDPVDPERKRPPGTTEGNNPLEKQTTGTLTKQSETQGLPKTGSQYGLLSVSLILAGTFLLVGYRQYSK